ncbi:MmgE/PrpD family protein [Pseudonocardia sp. N23]|uniref:MmgE/PrpD family protein n=1 Tax=Pseudonocardia sp. N23 TaxID=1987376 RepID=UPI000BFD42F5|nr:MmgE/PrpD family protein [Pseudonocardia sp. N23]GAY07488.1 MmgE/PrpD family protein [Pseudonocardia sp. N23]
MSARLTPALAEFVADPARHATDEIAALATAAVLDTVGCALAATSEPAVTRLLDALGPLPGGPCRVLGAKDTRTDERTAALVNGTAGHALDFDDVDDALTGHPSTVLVPALLAVAESVGASGPDVVEAYWRGLVVERALAAGLGIGPHYARGWHSTATLGVPGAAAVAAVLLGLDAATTRHALGIAASRAAGSRRNFGSMTKPLHAGTAAADGVFAARLAAAGFTADADQLDSPLGYLALFSDQPDLTAAADRALGVLADPGPAAVNVKLHACCYATHAPADAALDLVAAGVRAEDVESVAVRVPPGGLRPLITRPPATELEGKFSMGYVVAACLSDGELRLSSFTDEAVTRAGVADLAARVTSAESLPPSGSGDGLEFSAEVVVRTRDGAAHTSHCPAPRGHATRPAGTGAVRAKFDDCLARGGHAADADAVWDSLSDLARAGVR